MKKTWKYPITVAWSEEDSAFVARVPVLPYCVAHGETHETALKNAKKMARLMLESMKKRKLALPPPSVTTERLLELSGVISLSAIARAASVSQTTLASKMKRKTPLTGDEGERLASVLLAHGVAM